MKAFNLLVICILVSSLMCFCALAKPGEKAGDSGGPLPPGLNHGHPAAKALLSHGEYSKETIWGHRLTDKLSHCSNTTELENILVDISEKRKDMIGANESVRKEKRNEIDQLWSDFKKKSQQNVIECKMNRTYRLIESYETIEKRIGMSLYILSLMGFDTDDEQVLLCKVRDDLSGAREAVDSKDMMDAMGHLKSANNSLVKVIMMIRSDLKK